MESYAWGSAIDGKIGAVIYFWKFFEEYSAVGTNAPSYDTKMFGIKFQTFTV